MPHMNETNQKTHAGSKPEEYDLLILGSGTAGKLLSWTFSKAGMKVVFELFLFPLECFYSLWQRVQLTLLLVRQASRSSLAGAGARTEPGGRPE